MNEQAGKNECVETTASMVLSELREVNSRLSNLIDRTTTGLCSVMGQPRPSNPNKDTVSQDLPPLFNEIRSEYCVMNRSIDELYEIIERVEL